MTKKDYMRIAAVFKDCYAIEGICATSVQIVQNHIALLLLEDTTRFKPWQFHIACTPDERLNDKHGRK